MKPAKICLVVICLIAPRLGAQTNIDTTPFAFTNSSGLVVTDAVATRVFPNKIYFRHSFGIGSARLENLSPELQQRFNYNPAKAAAADQQEAIAKKQQMVAAEKSREQHAVQTRIQTAQQALIQRSRTISGKIIQKIPEGLLVDSGREDIDQVGHTDVEFNARGDMSTSKTVTLQEGDTAGALCLGLVLLADHPRYNQLVDDNVVVVLAYPDGQFSYKAVSGGQKTVRKFTADFNKAFSHQ